MNTENILEKLDEGSIKIIGFSTENEYNYLMKLIYENIKDKNSVIVENGFAFPHTPMVITSVQNSLHTINLNALKSDDIILTNNVLLNKKIQVALLNILQPVLLIIYINILQYYFSKMEVL